MVRSLPWLGTGPVIRQTAGLIPWADHEAGLMACWPMT
jgi:hypothetical protein